MTNNLKFLIYFGTDFTSFRYSDKVFAQADNVKNQSIFACIIFFHTAVNFTLYIILFKPTRHSYP